MIRIGSSVVKEQKKIFNQCVFHPTDAVEDAWGKRIIDKMAEDGAIDTVRVYAMLEDIAYRDEDGNLAYDFRTSDTRLDYLTSLGFNLVIAYAGIPDCITSKVGGRTSVAKNKTRYKGKMWNGNPPDDYAEWEEVCYQYTKHISERYGERVNGWKFHCFNEPDVVSFFMGELDDRKEASKRCAEYLKLYEHFVRGVRRANKTVMVGGPALACVIDFLECFLNGVKERGLEMNYIAVHTYGTDPELLNSGEETLSVKAMMKRVMDRVRVIEKCGFSHLPIVMDEWGASSHGFFNSEECKILMFRETEINSVYFIRFIKELTDASLPLENLMICLSGQHEMVEDFTGFRNFFTLNFIKKPIYNAYVLASKLHTGVVECENNVEYLTVLPTKSDKGEYAAILAYAKEDFSPDAPEITEAVEFSENIVGKKITVWCIDGECANPYRLWQRMGEPRIEGELIKVLREEGKMKPKCSFVATENAVDLKLTANAVYLITVE